MAHSHHHQQGVAREHLHFPQMMPDDLFTAGFGGLSGVSGVASPLRGACSPAWMAVVVAGMGGWGDS